MDVVDACNRLSTIVLVVVVVVVASASVHRLVAVVVVDYLLSSFSLSLYL